MQNPFKKNQENHKNHKNPGSDNFYEPSSQATKRAKNTSLNRNSQGAEMLTNGGTQLVSTQYTMVKLALSKFYN